MERVMEQSVEEKEEAKGTSREPGALAGVYEVLSQRAIDEAIRIGVEAGTAAAERRLEEGKAYSRSDFYEEAAALYLEKLGRGQTE